MSKTKKKFYKRWWFWLIVVILLMGISGSKSNEAKKVASNESKTTTNSESKTTNKTEIFKVGDTIQTRNYKITVNKVEPSNGGQFFKPKDGKEFLKIDISIENTSDKEQAISSVLMFKVVDKDGRSYNQTITENQNGQLDGKIGAGRKMTGEYVVEVPKGSTGLQLEFDSSLFSTGQVIVDLN